MIDEISLDKALARRQKSHASVATSTVPVKKQELEQELVDSDMKSHVSGGASRASVRKPAPVTNKGKKVESAIPDEKKSQKCEHAFLREVPREIVAFAKSKFPAATNQTDAVCAYIYVRSGRSIEVEDHIKELAETWSEDKSFESMDKRMQNLEQTQKKIYELLDDMSLVVSYLMFDRLGFRREQPRNTRDVNLYEPGMDDLIASVKIQAKKLRQRQALKDGRPQRQGGVIDD